MSLFFDDTHKTLQEMVRKFAQTEVAPRAAELDEAQGFNIEAFKKMGDLWILGITADPDFGGAGMDCVAATMVM